MGGDAPLRQSLIQGDLMHARKLCIVMPAFNGGGAERIGVNLANHYTDAYEVSLVVFKDSGPYRQQVSPAVKILSLDTDSRKPYRALANLLRQEAPHAVLSMFRNCNTVLGISRYFYSDYHLVMREANTLHAIKQKNRLRQWKNIKKMQLAYRRADAVISNSQDALDELINHRIVDRTRTHVVGNPIDLEAIERLSQEPPQHPWLKPEAGCKVILNVGRLHHQKNQELLIEAFAKAQSMVPELRLIIIGEGKRESSLKSQAQHLGVADIVSFPGFQQNPYPFYRNAHAFVLSSRWEGFPNVMLEAMACRTPVISTDCPGAPADLLLQGKCGTLVGQEQPGDLANAIINTVTAPSSAEIDRADERAREFSHTAIASRYAEILQLE